MKRYRKLLLFSAVLGHILDAASTIYFKKKYPEMVELNPIFRKLIEEERFGHFLALKFSLAFGGMFVQEKLNKKIAEKDPDKGERSAFISSIMQNMVWIAPICNIFQGRKAKNRRK